VCDPEIEKDEWLRATSEFLLEGVCRKDTPTKRKIFLQKEKIFCFFLNEKVDRYFH